MDRRDISIRPLAADDLEALIAYLEDHLLDNGRNGVPLFQPQSRGTTWRAADRLALFREGMAAPVGYPRWRRFWAAFDPRGDIAGHADLRAHAEASSAHRALLGTGVHRAHRRRGIGRALIQETIAWARRATAIEWIDLDFLTGNTPAERLYQGLGFQQVATIADLFRIDGQSVGSTVMTLRIRS
ncbi:MAG: GNAT family N-acetyltransferase [Pseudomonadota bacterium]